MKISEHFDVREFVPKEIWDKWGVNSIWWVNPKLVELAELIRNHFNASVTINNWHTGGSFNWRGLRTPSCTEGASLSQHRFMNAIDINVGGKNSDEVFDEIFKNQGKFMTIGLTTMEDKSMTKGWTHLDCRNTGKKELLIVKP